MITAEELKDYCDNNSLNYYCFEGDWSEEDESEFIAAFGEYETEVFSLGYDDGNQEWKIVVSFKDHNQHFATIYFTNSWDSPPWKNKWEEVEPYTYSEIRFKPKNSK